ncbi:MAG TPA: RNA 2',3'-cyclic phosphodiesterase [Pyrinomonadaceae bacterium]|nr:RNA 2',3'-cyclic phosphodiesterase [Pyrinomonadaceae bacterium]
MPSTEISNKWRVFVAIELPAPVRRELIKHIDRLRDSIPEARASWSREDNLHLTLKFLGDIPVTNVEQLSAAASIAASKVGPFEIVVEACGSFPPRGQPRVLWIGIDDPSGKLSELNRALEDECAKAGFAREPRVFHPHLTIARIRKPQGSRRLAVMHKEIGFNREIVRVLEMLVIRSELRSEGSRHTIVSRHAFSPSME